MIFLISALIVAWLAGLVTTAILAPLRVASAAEFQVKKTRPNSTMPINSAKKTIETKANSTAAAPF
jgi:hypothetical protein